MFMAQASWRLALDVSMFRVEVGLIGIFGLNPAGG
jgi:hypothetical protein